MVHAQRLKKRRKQQRQQQQKPTIKDNKITHGHTNQNIINQICNVKLLIDGTLSGV
jgi:hypothetical protein